MSTNNELRCEESLSETGEVENETAGHNVSLNPRKTKQEDKVDYKPSLKDLKSPQSSISIDNLDEKVQSLQQLQDQSRSRQRKMSEYNVFKGLNVQQTEEDTKKLFTSGTHPFLTSLESGSLEEFFPPMGLANAV